MNDDPMYDLVGIFILIGIAGAPSGAASRSMASEPTGNIYMKCNDDTACREEAG